MNVTLVMPVKNEEKSISQVLECIRLQTMAPDEIIIVDGGSTDRTVEIISAYQHLLPIKVFQIGPAFPGKGRNFAIANASYDIIALTDAGLRLGNDWLESLITPFICDPNLEVVFGGYRPLCRNSFQQATALFVANNKDSKYNFRFPVMPSMAIKKSVYQKLGGCPENLRATEDSIFFRRLFEYKPNFYVSEKAVIDWEMDDSWQYLIRKVFQAAKYEILGGYIRKRSLILIFLYPSMLLLIFASLSTLLQLALLAPVLFGLRISGSKKMDRELYNSLISSFSGIICLSLVTFIADISHIAGNLAGFYFYSKLKSNPKLRLWRGAPFGKDNSFPNSTDTKTT